ncbi:L,D-transpeptidase [uncultured Bosea sp.]|uniref:L,D-transpeptidase n=1 Tax=uncultured Bosea sp. TaxID=211457 RepID=UPI00263B6CC5|nr:L,D-transpeptidase [uncultured Bosea sp.]
MRRVLGLLAALILSAFAGVAHAGVDVRVNIPAQRMSVTTTDGEAYEWKISSGRKGFRSPNGVYRPTRLEKNWYSRKYGGAMPYSVFFRGGYAIHGTGAVGALGRPASHGCIRLHPANAAKLFALVKKHGASQTRIALNGAAPDNLSRFAKASTSSKAKLAKAGSSKHKIARAKHRSQATSVAQQRRGGDWEAARGQILLRPALPAGAYGYQPYYPSGYGWR